MRVKRALCCAEGVCISCLKGQQSCCFGVGTPEPIEDAEGGFSRTSGAAFSSECFWGYTTECCIFCSIWFEAEDRISCEQTVCFHLLFVKQDSRQQCPTPPEKRPNEKGVPHRKRRSPQVPTSPRPFSTHENKAWRLSFLASDEKAKEIPERRRKRPKSLYKCFSFDDIWMQRNQKRKLEKETQPEKGTQLQHFPEDQLKVRTHTLSSSSPGTVFLSLLWLFSIINHVHVLLLCLVPVLTASLWVWQLWMESDYLNTKLSHL